MAKDNGRDALARQVMQVSQEQAKILSIYDRQRENGKLSQRRAKNASGSSRMTGLGAVVGNISRSPEALTSVKPREVSDLDNKPRVTYEIAAPVKPWTCPVCRQKTDGQTYYGYLPVQRTNDFDFSPKNPVPCPECSPAVLRAGRKKVTDNYLLEMVRNHKFPNAQNLPKNAPDLRLENYPGDKAALAHVRDFVDGKFDNIILIGKPGRGKTGLAIAAVNAATETGAQALFLPFWRYLDLIRENYNRGDNDWKNHVTDIALSIEILVIDDLGAEKTTEKSIEEFQALITERLARGLRTLITTNYTLDKLAADWHMPNEDEMAAQRLVSRIDGSYTPVTVGGVDLRRAR